MSIATIVQKFREVRTQALDEVRVVARMHGPAMSGSDYLYRTENQMGPIKTIALKRHHETDHPTGSKAYSRQFSLDELREYLGMFSTDSMWGVWNMEKYRSGREDHHFLLEYGGIVGEDQDTVFAPFGRIDVKFSREPI